MFLTYALGGLQQVMHVQPQRRKSMTRVQIAVGVVGVLLLLIPEPVEELVVVVTAGVLLLAVV